MAVMQQDQTIQLNKTAKVFTSKVKYFLIVNVW